MRVIDAIISIFKLSLSTSIHLNLYLTLRDRADTIITLPPYHPPKTFFPCLLFVDLLSEYSFLAKLVNEHEQKCKLGFVFPESEIRKLKEVSNRQFSCGIQWVGCSSYTLNLMIA